ncbi:GTP-binding protein [Streptomyces coelicoflavus]|uniref:GTP-binding protein n=1 Tax=Streptomyces coelicoflavus TaxID=285562 RepID=UPI0036C72AA4
MDARQYKVVLLGDGAVGKTAFVKRLLTGEFQSSYTPTASNEAVPLTVDASDGTKLVLNVWDFGCKSPLDEYIVGADAALLMFDMSSRITLKNLSSWWKRVEGNTTGTDVPAVVIGNKSDTNRPIKSSEIPLMLPRGISPFYAEISAKDNTNLVEPLLYLVRRFTGQGDLSITAVNGRPVPAAAPH